MKKVILITFLCLISGILKAQKQVLVFSKTNGYRHASIEHGKLMFTKMFNKNEINVIFSEDSLVINHAFLKKIDVIVFLSTTGNILGQKEKKALQKYIHNGGGFVGIHAATDTELDWDWYINLVGAAFKSHPKQQNALVKIIDPHFEPMQHFGETWLHFDEWYNFKNPLTSNCNVLANVEEDSYEGGTMGSDHPVVWYQHFEGAKVFVTSLGHTNESYTNPDFVKMITKAVVWASK